MSPRFPKRVTVDLRREKLFIDGEEFPYLLTRGGVALQGLGAEDELATITLSFFAETVEVIPAEPEP